MRGYGINDNDEIIGDGTHPQNSGMCWRSAPDAGPSGLSTPSGGGTLYPLASLAMAYDHTHPGPVFTVDREFLGDGEVRIENQQNELLPDLQHWQIGDGGELSNEAVEHTFTNVGPDGWMWGEAADDWTKGVVRDGGLLPELPFPPMNVLLQPNGSILALAKYRFQGARVFNYGAWRPAEALADALDMDDRGVAIGRPGTELPAPIRINGRWQPIERTAPDVPASWEGTDVDLLDTTPRGWILAKRGEGEATSSAVMLPIRIEAVGIPGFREAVGIDSTSGRASAADAAAQDKLWIMAPAGGGSTEFTLSAPIHAAAPLELSGTGVNFGASGTIALTAEESSVSVSAAQGASSGIDVDLELKLGDESSLSRPLAVKVMKARTVSVHVYKVPHPVDGGPDLVPSAAGIEDYLDKVFTPQINVAFNVQLFEDPLVPEQDWDSSPANGSLDGHPDPDPFGEDSPGPEQATILGAVGSAMEPNVTVFLIGGAERLDGGASWGFANRSTRTVWISADSRGGRQAAEIMRTIAHEIGHIFCGYGHPDQGHGPAPLPGTDHTRRLMVSGRGWKIEAGVGLVKGEWNAAETWLREVVDPPEE